MPSGSSSSTLVEVGPALAVALVLLTVVAAAVVALGRLGTPRTVVVAVLRATAQLAVVSLLVAGVLGSLRLSGLFVLVMCGVATWTSARRVTSDRSGLWVWLAVVGGSVPAVVLLVASGVVPARGLVVVPVAGILVGGGMTATSLAGRRALDELRTRRGEVEAALSLGFLPRDAALEIGRPAASSALVPALDQTRTVGLVTLPGAFVGMLLAGASPVEAGAVQLFVLVTLLAVEAVAVLVVLELVARGRVR